MDDVPAFLESTKQILNDAGFSVATRLSPLKAVKELRKANFDLLITTLVMRELGGFDVIRGVRNSGNRIPIMMITGYGSEQAAGEAMRLGATDYMNKPVTPQELVARVRRITEPQQSVLAPKFDPAQPMLTRDPAMQAIMELIHTVAVTNSRVLITGETGTGKQLVARAIHNASQRAAQPFIDLNCAAIPDTLLESELFGHEKGAFTGADARRIGRFEEAGKGTLFLDEIGEMGYGVQAKLLKVLQDGTFTRIGGQKVLTSEARVIAATNRDLEKEASEGRFRSDLFYRLHVVTIQLPPLRKRPNDIALLAEHFLQRFGAGGPDRRFAPETLQAMTRYPWPGNVRELENLVERIAVLNHEPVIGIDALPERIVQQAIGFATAAVSYTGRYSEAKDRFERDYVTSLLAKHHGNMAAAARQAGIDRSQFFRMVQRLGLDPKTFHPKRHSVIN
ncbi:MAG: sigma-54 dependent transcriptional regulator [Tepidisphaeraceae bacterium]